MDELERKVRWIGGSTRVSEPPDIEQIMEKINEIVRWINSKNDPHA